MKTYFHNGETVIYQTIQDNSFLNLLHNAGIVPEEIPDEDFTYRVFKYSKDGIKRYACILVANAPDTYIEKVYITFVFPEDGFYQLMLDVQSQINGNNPTMMKSRLHLAIEYAEKKAADMIQSQYPDQYTNWLLMGYPEDIEKEYQFNRKLALMNYGYNLEMLDCIHAPDVDMESVKQILK